MSEVPQSAQFRVFVVASDGSGRLLGLADKIKPVLPRKSLLPLREVGKETLGSEVWRVDFGDGGDQPELLVNNSIDGVSDIVRHNAAFRSLVMPSVLRVVLTRIVLVERADPDDDGGEWWDGWFRLARAMLPQEDVPHIGIGLVEDTDVTSDALRWIGDVVGAFATDSVDAVSAYSAALSGGRA